MRQIITILIACFTSLICSAQVKNVKKGDVLQVNGVKGIVFNVNEDGNHGQMIALRLLEENRICIVSNLHTLKLFQCLTKMMERQIPMNFLPMHLQKESHLPTILFIIGVSH